MEAQEVRTFFFGLLKIKEGRESSVALTLVLFGVMAYIGSKGLESITVFERLYYEEKQDRKAAERENVRLLLENARLLNQTTDTMRMRTEKIRK